MLMFKECRQSGNYGQINMDFVHFLKPQFHWAEWIMDMNQIINGNYQDSKFVVIL